MAYGTVKVDNITFDNGGSDQNVTVSGLYRATTSGVTVSGTIAATTVSGVTVIGSTTVSGDTITGTTANFTSGNFSNIISSAATMSGALIMANQQQVQFREAVGNGVNHIALQAPAIVSADQVITLPDETGTVITTGDNGSVSSTMLATNLTISAAAGSAAAPSIAFTGDLNTGIYSPGADQLAVSTGGTGRLFIDSSGRLLVGTSTSVNTIIEAGLQVQSTGANAYASVGRWTAASENGGLIFNKSRGASVGTRAVVNNSDGLGEILFSGDDGTNFVPAAQIRAFVDGTPDANDMPGRLVFFTTADGASSVTERMRIDSSGRVGIGTSSPSEALAVAGRAIINQSGSDTSPTLYLSAGAAGDPVTAAYSPRIDFSGSSVASPGSTWIAADGSFGARSLVFATGADAAGTERLRIDSSGRVGIGTASPESQLNVGVGTARLKASQAGITTAISIVGGDYNQQNNAALILSGGQANDNRVNSWVIQSLATGTDNLGVNDLRFCTGFYSGTAYGISEKLRIDSTGRVGIGTSSPQGLLGIYKGSTAAGIARATRYSLPFAAGGDNGISIEIGREGNNSNVGAAIQMAVDNYAGSSASHITFRTSPATVDTSTDTSQERLRIDSSGNVMMGTSTPGRKLSVNAGNGDGVLIRTGGYRTFGSNATLYLSGGTFDNGTGAGFAIASEQVSNGNHVLKFCSATANADATNYAIGAERMRIDSSGSVLIGTSNAISGNYVFEVVGKPGANWPQMLMRNPNASSGKFWQIGPDNGHNNFVIYNQSSAGLYITDGQTNWTSSSDERLKTDLVNIEDGLAKVGALRAVTGRFKTDPEGTSKSFLIAQDVLSVFPEPVDTQNPDKLGLAYTEMIPLLVAALKESKERIETLEAKVAALQSA